jgi:hypothetical protein
MINIKGIKYYTFADIKEKAITKLKTEYPDKCAFGKKQLGSTLKGLGYVAVRKNVNGINCHFYVMLKDYQHLIKLL